MLGLMKTRLWETSKILNCNITLLTSESKSNCWNSHRISSSFNNSLLAASLCVGRYDMKNSSKGNYWNSKCDNFLTGLGLYVKTDWSVIVPHVVPQGFYVILHFYKSVNNIK